MGFLAPNFQNLIIDRARRSTFRISGLGQLAVCSMFCGLAGDMDDRDARIVVTRLETFSGKKCKYGDFFFFLAHFWEPILSIKITVQNHKFCDIHLVAGIWYK